MHHQDHRGGDGARPFILIHTADYADGTRATAPALLELALNCTDYAALPYSGGVMDQPAGLMRKLRQVGNVFHAVKQYKADGQKPGESAAWKKKNETAWAIVEEVEKLRETHG